LKPKTRNPKLILTLTIALILLAILPVSAQFSGNIDVSLKSAADTITVGDPITLTLRVIAPTEDTVGIPQLDATWGDFEIRHQSAPVTTPNDDGTATTEQTIIGTLFDVGAFSTPNWKITLTGASGNSTKRAVPQASITVRSVLTDAKPTLRDLKPQADLPVPSPLPWVLAAIIAAALVFFAGRWLWRWWQKHRPTPAEPVPVPEIDPRPAHEIALAELTRIKALDLPGQGRLKQHYTLVSDCLRQYLENRYGIPALEHTTTEVKASLRHAKVDRATVHQFITLFDQSDLVKFARFIPDTENAWHFLTDARQLIESLAEREQAAAGN